MFILLKRECYPLIIGHHFQWSLMDVQTLFDLRRMLWPFPLPSTCGFSNVPYPLSLCWISLDHSYGLKANFSITIHASSCTPPWRDNCNRPFKPKPTRPLKPCTPFPAVKLSGPLNCCFVLCFVFSLTFSWYFRSWF